MYFCLRPNCLNPKWNVDRPPQPLSDSGRVCLSLATIQTEMSRERGIILRRRASIFRTKHFGQLDRTSAVVWVVFLFLCLFHQGAAHCAEQQHGFDQLRSDHNKVLKEMNTSGKNGAPIELDDQRTPALLESGWMLAGQWAALYLNTHGSLTADQLKRVFVGFAPPPHGVKSKFGDFLEYDSYAFAGTVIRIAPSVYVVQSCYWKDFATGDFLIVTRGKDGSFQPLWNIKDVAKQHYPERDEIGRWVHLTRRAYYNGPLDVKRVIPLPVARNGHPRFIVDAVQNADGGTALAQLSVWEWTGTESVPLLIKTYEYVWGEDSFHFDGNTLRIGTKEDPISYFSCGECSDPKGIWTVRITPEGVDDLGHRFVNPEMKWADDLLSAIGNGKDASEMARPQVIEAIKSAMAEVAKTDTQPAETKEPNPYTWGMFAGFRRIGNDGFAMDFDEAKMRFSYLVRDGKPYFTHISIE